MVLGVEVEAVAAPGPVEQRIACLSEEEGIDRIVEGAVQELCWQEL